MLKTQNQLRSVIPTPQALPYCAPNQSANCHMLREKPKFFRAPAPAPWAMALPVNRVVTTIEHRKPQLMLTPALDPLTLALPLTEVVVDRDPGRRYGSCSLQIQLCHQRHRKYSDSIGMFSHKDMPSQLVWVTVLPNFIETNREIQTK